jgi:hypothetical protein
MLEAGKLLKGAMAGCMGWVDVLLIEALASWLVEAGPSYCVDDGCQSALLQG